MFCDLPNDSVTFVIAVNGGIMTTSTSAMSPISSSSDLMNAADSRCVTFIFQLSATIFLRMTRIQALECWQEATHYSITPVPLTLLLLLILCLRAIPGQLR